MQEFFSFNFPLRDFFFVYFARPPHKFSNGPSLMETCMETPRWLGINMADGTSLAEFWYKSANLFPEELINIKVILFLTLPNP